MIRVIVADSGRHAFSTGFRAYSTLRPVAKTIARLFETPPSEGQTVVVEGYIRSIRNQKTRSFVAVGDGTTLQPLQALLSPRHSQSLSNGTAVGLTGVWRKSPNPKNQSYELDVQDVVIYGAADPVTFPLQKKYQSPEYLRTIPHLRSRTPFNSTLLRFRSLCIAQITKFFSERDFVQTHPPIITSSDCEGAGEVFEISKPRQNELSRGTDGGKADFFRDPKYLTVSTQLHLEAMAQSVGRVWTLSPTFRAERSETARHLSEFYMLEAELGFTTRMDDIMDVVEHMLRDLTSALYKTRLGAEVLHGKRTGESGIDISESEELLELDRRWQGMMSTSWPRITYTHAVKLLHESGLQFQHKPSWGAGLQAEHERYIATTIGAGQPVFVTHYPRLIKPFYMLPNSSAAEEGETVDCFDLLVPEACEIAGGSMREHRLPQLLEAMQSHGLVKNTETTEAGLDEDALGSLKWYVDLRRWGSNPHGGFGLGFDRLLAYLTGIPNIREVVAFPRWVGRCDC